MKKLIYTLPLLLALGACSNEEAVNQEPVQPTEGGYYLSMNFSLPTDLTTRDPHDTPGIGDEAKLTNVDLYLIDADGADSNTKHEVLWSKTNITAGDGTTGSGEIDKVYSLKISLSSTGDNNEVDKLANLVGHNVTILLVCNTNKYTGYSAVEENSVFSNSKFTASVAEVSGGLELPMASYELPTAITDFKNINETDAAKKKVAVRGLFKADGADLIYALTTSTTPIKVERAVARLDLKANGTSWDYDLYDGAVENGSTIKLRLSTVTPFNLNTGDNNSYVVRQGATAGTDASNDVALLSGTWVADPSWSYESGWAKAQPAGNQLQTSEPPYTVATGATNTKNVTALASNPDDGKFYPWLYIPENTVPKADWMDQANHEEDFNKYTTGVLFKFQVLDKSGSNVVTTSTASTDLPDGVTIKDGKLIVTLAKSGKTETFEPDGTDFYIPYCGFIKHGAPMTYGIVRNTIYQLSVNKIESLPNATVAPYYLTLDINVLKWSSVPNAFEF